MVAIKNIVFLAVGITAAVIRRDVKSLQSDLNTINSDTTALDNAVKNFNGGIFNAVPVQNAEQQVEKDIQTATTNAGKESPLSASDSQSLIDYINNTLEPNIKTTLSDLKAKKSQFTSAGVQGTVKDDLNTLKSDTDSYGAALIKLAPSSKVSAAQAALSKIDADFDDAIKYYS